MAVSGLGITSRRKNFAPQCLPDTQTQEDPFSQRTCQHLLDTLLAFSLASPTVPHCIALAADIVTYFTNSLVLEFLRDPRESTFRLRLGNSTT